MACSVINGKTQWGNERELHHYGATLNAIPVLDSFKAFPRREHLLRLGGCALLGHLTNIHPSGAASMAWHGDPGLLRRDGYSGDYGIGLYGYWRSAGAYLACVPHHGCRRRMKPSCLKSWPPFCTALSRSIRNASSYGRPLSTAIW